MPTDRAGDREAEITFAKTCLTYSPSRGIVFGQTPGDTLPVTLTASERVGSPSIDFGELIFGRDEAATFGEVPTSGDFRLRVSECTHLSRPARAMSASADPVVSKYAMLAIRYTKDVPGPDVETAGS